jgi:protein-L-isoaspartate(D-aspartate) O-methyltransferase
MVGQDGKVIGIEHLPELTELSIKNLEKDPESRKMMEEGRMRIINGDGRKGVPEEGTPIQPLC